MPHTSHKKKQTHSKRQEVVGDDGWTHVMSNNLLAMPRNRPSRRLMTVRIEEAPEGTTQSEVLAKYTDIEKRWTASESWKSMETTLKTRVIGSDTRIDACVLFGSGTFTGLGLGWINRGHVAMYQLAVFKAVVGLIEHCTGQRPAAYAQEPRYNTQDRFLLNTLAVQKVEDPDGFHLLTNRSFAYCPGAEQYVVLQTLLADPFLYLGGELDSYTGALGYLQSRIISVSYEVYSPEDRKRKGEPTIMSLKEIEELKEGMIDGFGAKIDEAWVRERRANQEPEVQVIERFLRNKEVAGVPDLDVQDQPLHDNHLCWPCRLD